MKSHFTLLFFVAALLISCTSTQKSPAISGLVLDSPKIEGKGEYVHSPYVTAGNRLYMVGHQDGSFPELGWHIKGEMGGIWNHPIKLMDGFDITLNWDDLSFPLDKAEKFTNYPMANVHQYSVPEKQLEVKRWQFVPDNTEGVFVQLEIENIGSEKQRFFIDFTGHVDLRPTWLGERTDMVDAQDKAEFNENINGWMVKDANNPWFVCFGSSIKPTSTLEVKSEFKGMGASNALEYPFELEPNSTEIINFIISGSYTSEHETIDTYKKIKMEWPALFESKKERYRALAKQTKLTIPDKKMQETFEWLKYNCDWLVRTVPEIGTGIGAGIPDYPWYFGVDSEYALMGYMAVGQDDVVYNTIQLLDSVSNAVNGNGKIIHEMSTNGAVFNAGNINETPQYASLIWHIYQWNGYKDFLKRYFPTIKKGLQWLLKENDADGNGFPEGFGMMEIHGLDSEMIDVAAYSQKGFVDAAKIADVLGDSA
ncbi:MAG: glycogen debranching protein, partial [Bacteroidota bacterium]